MEQGYIRDKDFDKVDFASNPLPEGEYERCSFVNCNFLNADLSGIVFVECTFVSCNLSMAKVARTSFREVVFETSKMMGMRFDECNELALSFSFDNCQLDHSSFYQLKLRKVVFKDSKLEEVDFTRVDLSNSVFDNCNLSGATFDNTILERTDFRTTHGYSIDPERNRIKKAKFSLDGIAGLLDKYDILIEP